MKFTIKTFAVIIMISLMATSSFGADFCGDEVQTREGPVVGAAAPDGGSCSYKGVPFAAPPLGSLRLKAPEPPLKRADVLVADEFGPSCVQKEASSAGGKSKSFSEDCLTLNIFRPAKKGKFPVMFWIHGGGHVQGSGSYEIYNGARLASGRDVVVVTSNYRLAGLGYLALPELKAEDPNGGTGNYGLLDSIQALKWTRENIAGFGGDPNNITVFGESAGGVQTCNILATPLADGLFQRAIIESGGCDLVNDLEASYQRGRTLTKAVGCEGDDVRECLRSKKAKEIIMAKNHKFSAWSHVDGYALSAEPVELFKQGKFNKTPVMVGSNKDEMNLIVALPGATWASRKKIRKMMVKALGEERTAKLLKLYSWDDYKQPVRLVAHIFSDAFGARAFAAAETVSPRAPVYMYRFDWDEERGGKKLGTFHGLEIPFVFGNLKLSSSLARWVLNKKARKRARPLSEKIMTYWTNFARTGDPNGGGLPKWLRYDSSKRLRIHLDTEISVKTIPQQTIERYNYLKSIKPEDFAGEI